jgi:PAS domain S-box-containing protein
MEPGNLEEDSGQRYRALVESTRALICIHDLEGKLLSVNQAAAQRLGYTPSDLVGRNLRDLLSPSVRHLFSDYLKRIREVSVDDGVMRVVTRDGEERIWAYCNIRIEELGRPSEVLGHAQDITDLKRAERLAREAQALRSVAQLANAAAHEINNPLAIIVGHLEMLRRSMTADADALARIDIAFEAAQRITAIISRMSTITRLERVDVSGAPAMLDLWRSSPDREGPT